jgi:hypothetical protein|tara:strand:- start:376 stop:639 length:264 start_codon:yes stop_codon:yes gene_type:complete
MSEQKYFIIRKDKWFDGKVKFTIMKDASFPLEEATRNLLAYDQLNDNKDYSYHLQKVDSQFMEDTTPLVLTEEVKTNGKAEEEELPF